MAYSTRWDIPFRDIQGTLRHIYIQQDGWTGGITTLQGGETPIDWDEDSSDNLLKRVRAKTGHIEVIEENYGDLVDLYPTTAKSHRVVAPYLFWGYMKPQTSTMPWEGGPRKLKFNIQSPLAMAADIKMPVINSVGGNVYMDWVFYQLMQIMEYNYIVMPVGTTTYTEAFNGELYNKVICPYSDEKEYKMTSDDDAYAPISVSEFLEQYCDTHDLVVHDTTNSSSSVILFSRFVNAGQYRMWTQDQIGGNLSEGTVVSSDALTDFFTSRQVAANNNSEKILRPYSGIDVYNEGEVFGNARWPVQRSEYESNGTYTGDLTPRGKWLTLSEYATLKTRMDAQQVGELKALEYLRVYRITLPATQEMVCKVAFDNLAPNNSYTVTIKFGTAYSLVGNILAKIGGGWVTIDLSSLSNDHEYKLDTFPETDNSGCLNIEFYCQQGYISTFDIVDISLEKQPNIWNVEIDDVYKGHNFVTSIEGDEGEKRLEYRIPWNQNFLSNFYETQLAYAGSIYPVYMLQSQTKAEITVRSSMFSYGLYLQKFYIDNTGRRWRIVAISQNPRKCEAKITLISSYILE